MRYSFSILLCLCLLSGHSLIAADGDVIERDQWFNGYLNGQAAMHARELIVQHANGTRSTTFDSKIKIARKLFMFNSVLTMEQKRSFVENTSGDVKTFHFEDNENGAITSAVGKIDGKTIEATVTTPTNSNVQTLSIPEGKELLGQAAGQKLMSESLAKVGDSINLTGVEMISGRLSIVNSTATLKSIKDNKIKVVEVRVDLLPMMPVTVEIDEHGHTKKMNMSVGGLISLRVVATDKPIKLEAAQFNINNMLKHNGKLPKAGDNRYRIGEHILKHIINDEFQSHDRDIMTIANVAEKCKLENKDEYLQAELQLETDNLELQNWATNILEGHKDKSIAERAELLRLAVRSHITKKDLSKGDASALETFKSRCGDCTEHANLLCAALRINGIPARTDVGFVYATKIGSWVGHAWNSAYDSEQSRWIHLDAAYPGLQRSQYIRTASTSGSDNQSTAKSMAQGMTVLMGQSIEVLD